MPFRLRGAGLAVGSIIAVNLVPISKDLVNDPGVGQGFLTPITASDHIGGIAIGGLRRSPVVSLQIVSIAHEVQGMGRVDFMGQGVGSNQGEVSVTPDFGKLQVDYL